MALPIFTIQSFNQSALQAAGAIFVQRVETVALQGNATEGRSTPMEKKMNDLTKSLLDDIQAQAKAKYPNAVALVDVHVDFSEVGKTGDMTFLAGQASATAIIRKAKKTGNTPVTPPMAPPMAPPMPMNVAPPMAMAAPVPVPGPLPSVGGRRKATRKHTKSRSRKH
jgi:uncharacterized protein YbjQ (UPF0145 family)